MSKKTVKKTEPKKASPRAKRGKAAQRADEITSEIVKAAAAPSLDEIRDRAFQIFRAGVNPSDPAADWFQAERELQSGARV